MVAGEFPWMVLIIIRHSDPSSAERCGGSLVSASRVITAAHCVSRDNGTQLRLRPDQVDLYLGKFDIKNSLKN